MNALPALPFHCQHFESALGEWEFLIAPPPADNEVIAPSLARG